MGQKNAISTETRQAALAECNKFVDFWSGLCKRSTGEITPTAHQTRRVYEALNNGNKRILCADATSSGKTFVTNLLHSLLSEEIGRPARTAVWAPNQAIQTAWTEEEQNSYREAMGMDPMQVVPVMGRSDLSLLDSDFDMAAVNYHKFGYTRPEARADNSYFSRFLSWCQSSKGPDILVFDECQLLKNPKSNKTRIIDEIIRATMDKYVVLLSAYPIPNRLKDAGVALHLLDPDRYTLSTFNYNSNPAVFRDLKMQGKLLTFTRDDLKEIFNLPELCEDTVSVDMEDKYKDRYMKYWRDGDMPTGVKIPLLGRTLLASKYDALENMADAIAKGDSESQILVYSYLRDGVTKEIARRLERVMPRRVGRIDGTVNRIEDRVEMAKQYREGKLRALANTIQTMGEGIPLTTYDRPSHIIILEPAITPCDYGEIVGRGYRKGQIAPVHIHTVLANSSELSDYMIKAKDSLETEYAVEFKPTWLPGTIDLDAYNMRIAKDRILKDKLYEGLRLDEVEEKLMNTDSHTEAANKGLGSLPRKSKDRRLQRFMSGMISSVELYGAGSKEIKRACSGEGRFADKFANMRRSYTIEDDSHLPPSKTAGFVTMVIKGLEELRGRKFGRILDYGCGSANLARALGRPIVNLDIDERMLQEAKKRCEGLELEHVKSGLRKMQYVKGNMAEAHMLFGNGMFDLVTASYSLMYLAQRYDGDSKFQREVEDTLIDTNGLLVPEGFFIATLPHYRTNNKIFHAFNEVLASYNLNPVLSDLFTGRATVNGQRRQIQKVYLVAAEKVKDHESGYTVPEGEFVMYNHTPRTYAASGGLSRIYLGAKFTQPSYGKDVRYSGKRIGPLDNAFSQLKERTHSITQP
ncbi:MAG: methyltransferase domain-containing protein [Candidatus Aenigmarchaeota archaeon]|nr:methyltransferase domain-containing protein [Candidatus Aenigmarchaeota archaeon]